MQEIQRVLSSHMWLVLNDTIYKHYVSQTLVSSCLWKLKTIRHSLSTSWKNSFYSFRSILTSDFQKGQSTNSSSALISRLALLDRLLSLVKYRYFTVRGNVPLVLVLVHLTGKGGRTLLLFERLRGFSLFRIDPTYWAKVSSVSLLSWLVFQYLFLIYLYILYTW